MGNGYPLHLELGRGHPERLVEIHSLRSADALQVGAALVAREGFRVLGPR